MNKRVFLMVLDSVGIGYMPDADKYGDEGANTLASCRAMEGFALPTLEKLGLYNIEGVEKGQVNDFTANVARMSEASPGKDTTIGHWEISGLISEQSLPTYPNGFPADLLEEFSKKTGRGVLCNKPYSGTQLLTDYGKAHVESGDLLVYTSADSVFQIAAHEEIVPIEELYRYCEIAREMLQGEHGVGRVIARPFVGEDPNYSRTSNRHDYSLIPAKETVLDLAKKQGLDVIGVGKIYDIFAGSGITATHKSKDNNDGMNITDKLVAEDFSGICFVNLVDFDMVYGHRNNRDGYGKALMEFDSWLGEFITKLGEDDMLIITADHGCDPCYKGTDHTREYTPMIAYGKNLKSGVNLGTRDSFSDIGATIKEYLDIKGNIDGKSFLSDISK